MVHACLGILVVIGILLASVECSYLGVWGSDSKSESVTPSAPPPPNALVNQEEQEMWALKRDLEKPSDGCPPAFKENGELGEYVKLVAQLSRDIINCEELPDNMREVNANTYILNELNLPTAKQTHLNAIVIIYQPFLISIDDDTKMHLIYHEVARAQLNDIIKAIEGEEDYWKKDIILAGSSYAGLMAIYHALRLVYSLKFVAGCGEGKNLLNQVKVLTFNTPPALTPQFAPYYPISPSNFWEITTEKIDRSTFARSGFVIMSEGKSHQISVTTKCVERATDVFNTHQIVHQLEFFKLFPISLNNHSKHLATLLTTYYDRAQAAVDVISDKLKESVEESITRELISCKGVLKNRLQSVITQQAQSTERAVNRFKIKGNWRKNGEITCALTSYTDDRRQGVVGCAFEEKPIIEYNISLEKRKGTSDDGVNESDDDDGDDIDDSDSMDAESVEEKASKYQEETRQGREQVDQCIHDLFELRYGLQVFSEYHPDQSNFLLSYDEWDGSEGFCKVTIKSSKFKELLEKRNEAFFHILTDPLLVPPKSCEGHLILEALAPAHTYHVSEYHEDVSSLFNPKTSFTIFSSHPNKYANLNNEIGEMMKQQILPILTSKQLLKYYDCKNVILRWSSPNFCPRICQAYPESHLCERVYIGDDDVKFTIRHGARYLSYFDQTLCSYQHMSNMRLQDDQSQTILLHIGVSNRKNAQYYIAIFLEGKQYQQYEGRMQTV